MSRPTSDPAAPSADTALRCGDCGAPMALRTGPFRPFYSCADFPRCRGSVGAHPDGRPMGTPADVATRRARREAHEALDALWRGPSRAMTRGEAYRWLAAAMGRGSAHIAEMGAADCARVVELCAAREAAHA